MKIGKFILPSTPKAMDLVEEIVQAEAHGFSSAWLAHIAGPDAMTTLAIAGSRTSTIELGTFVVPTFPRHPVAMAQQGLTVQAVSNNRFTLGIGLSHRVVMEGRLGYDWDHPIRHMREYLSVLRPALAGESVTFQGEEYRVDGVGLGISVGQPPQILVAALGPQMLKLCGRMADGTAVWMGGPTYLRDHAIPTIRQAAEEAGRPAPRIVASVPVCVTDKPDEVRKTAARAFARYGQLPSYRAILDRDGASEPTDVSLIGSEDEVRAGLRAFADAGVTDFAAAIFAPDRADAEQTIEVLRSTESSELTS